MKWNLFPLNIRIEDSTALLDKKVFFITFFVRIPFLDSTSLDQL